MEGRTTIDISSLTAGHNASRIVVLKTGRIMNPGATKALKLNGSARLYRPAPNGGRARPTTTKRTEDTEEIVLTSLDTTD